MSKDCNKCKRGNAPAISGTDDNCSDKHKYDVEDDDTNVPISPAACGQTETDELSGILVEYATELIQRVAKDEGWTGELHDKYKKRLQALSHHQTAEALEMHIDLALDIDEGPDFERGFKEASRQYEAWRSREARRLRRE